MLYHIKNLLCKTVKKFLQTSLSRFYYIGAALLIILTSSQNATCLDVQNDIESLPNVRVRVRIEGYYEKGDKAHFTTHYDRSFVLAQGDNLYLDLEPHIRTSDQYLERATRTCCGCHSASQCRVRLEAFDESRTECCCLPKLVFHRQWWVSTLLRSHPSQIDNLIGQVNGTVRLEEQCCPRCMIM